MPKIGLDIKGELTKEDAAIVAIIIAMTIASVYSFSVGSTISEFFGAVFAAIAVLLTSIFVSRYTAKGIDNNQLHKLFNLERLAKRKGYYPMDIVISLFEEARIRAIKEGSQELAKELEKKIEELKESESNRKEIGLKHKSE